jgi:hypothetical protein
MIRLSAFMWLPVTTRAHGSKMEISFLLSLWGATLSTVLGFLAIIDRFRARPIIRAHAKAQSQVVREEPRFVSASVRTGHYDDLEIREFYIEYRVENHGTKSPSGEFRLDCIVF